MNVLTRVFKEKKFFKNKQLIRFFYNYQKKYYLLAIGIGILLFINVVLTLPMPLVTRFLIDKVIPSRDFALLNMMCLLLLGVILFAQLSAFSMRYLTLKYKARIHYDLEKELYYHVQDLPMNYFARRPSGYILSRIAEVSSVEAVMADTFLLILRDIVTMLVGAFFILRYNLVLGIVSLGMLPFFIFSIKAFHKKIKGVNKKLHEESAQYTGKLEQNINSIEKIKSSVKEEKVGRRVLDRLSSVIKLRIKAQLISAFAGIVSSFIGMIAPFVVLWYGVSEIMRGNLTLGTFVAINSFLGYLFQPARRLTDVGYSFSQAMAGMERIYEVFMEKEEDKSGDPIHCIDEIHFQNVDFSYNEEVQVIKNLNLKIKKGERIALVGESGQGKSTMVKLIMKFYTPGAGNLYISGRPIDSIGVKSLRQKIAYISQKQKILEEELEDDADNPNLQALLKKFRLGKSINSQDMHQTEFSGGEVQKLELSESILRDADVLIVDEGTSNIDYNSERVILNELFSKYKDKIIIFIAHRLNSITDFERIVVMDKGTIAEEGTHDVLSENEGKYRFLWGIHKDPSGE
ncbi:MAG: ABC transporter ATP-binding protein [bacterium]|nr:ABC transporter ATP-binding protein [bacterium]